MKDHFDDPEFDASNMKSKRSTGFGSGLGRCLMGFALIAALVMAGLYGAAFVQASRAGLACVRRAVIAEAIGEYNALKARAPGVVSPKFHPPRVEDCRAVSPWVIRCRYVTHLGRKAGGVYEARYRWDGRRCKLLSRKTLALF